MGIGLISVPLFVKTFKAAGDLSTNQYSFVKLSADNKVTVAGAGDPTIGVLQNKPSAANQDAVVMMLGISRLKVNAANTRIAQKSAASGLATDVTANNDYYGAIALEAGAAQNDLISAFVIPGYYGA